MPLRILLVDDQTILLDVLRRQFEADAAFCVVATAGTVAEALAATAASSPQAILLDIELGKDSGLDAIRAIRALKPDARVVMMSMFDHAVYRDRAFELGADAYVTKGVGFDTLRTILLEARPRLAGPDAGRFWLRPRGAQVARMTLTPRELFVVRELSVGRREKEVADELDITVSSVGTYLKRAMLKVGVASRAELFRNTSALGTATETCG